MLIALICQTDINKYCASMTDSVYHCRVDTVPVYRDETWETISKTNKTFFFFFWRVPFLCCNRNSIFELGSHNVGQKVPKKTCSECIQSIVMHTTGKCKQSCLPRIAAYYIFANFLRLRFNVVCQNDKSSNFQCFPPINSVNTFPVCTV